MHRPLSSLTAPEFMEFVRGRHSADKGQPFNEHETELWRWGFSYRVNEKQEKQRAQTWH